MSLVHFLNGIKNATFFQIACMPDDRNSRGERDQGGVADAEKWDMNDLIEQTGATRKEIAEAIKVVGNDREKVEEYIRNRRIL